MNFKAYFLMPVLLAMGACGHLQTDRNTPDQTEYPLDPSQAGEQTSLPDEVISDTESVEIVLSEAETAATDVLPALPENSPTQDLFDRLRNGFTFPELTSKYIAQYERWDTQHPTYLSNLFVRATPFLYHIVEELEKRGLPMELALLPAIESAYKPEALSRSNAGGLWQFIPATGREFGLHQNWWYDGRKDPLASTNAALDYLTQLNKMFDGDWFLTLAAYNAGPGTVQRAMRRNQSRRKQTDYQSLSLRSETRRYVPKLIALKNIIANPEKYNIELLSIPNQPYFEVLPLNGQIDLKSFASDAGINQSLLRHLNAGFRRWASPPEGPHRLLVPIGKGGTLLAQAKTAIQNAPAIQYQNHRISQGDTLSAIANRYHISVAALKKANNLSSSRIRAGRDLLIPVSAAYTPAANTVSNTDERVFHRVQQGDTLWSIARLYKVPLQQLMAWNNMTHNQILRLNQSLLVLTKSLN